MLSTDSIQDSLASYTPEETFFKNFYETNHLYFPLEYYPPNVSDNDALVKMASAFFHEKAFSLPEKLQEDQFFNKTAQIHLVRHNRYMYSVDHSHSFYEILYVLNGSCLNVVDGQALPLRTGDVCVIPPDVIHSISVNSDSLILNILLRESTFTEVFSSFLVSSSVLADFFKEIIYSSRYKKYLLFHTFQDQEIQNQILQMYGEQLQNQPYSEQIMTGQLFIFLGKLLQKHENSVEYPTSYANRISSVPQITNYIRQNCRNVTLESCGKAFHFSPQYISALLTKYTGKNFSTLRTEARMRLASQLLIESSVSIQELGHVLGYSDPDYFMKVFKKYYSCTPSIYRNLHKHL